MVAEIGGRPVSSGEPAALELGIDPSTPLSLPAGESTTVTTTERNDGPGDASNVSVGLSTAAGWIIKPSSPVAAGSLSVGSSAKQTWTVTAPSGSTSPVTAALEAHATYVSSGRSDGITTSQQGSPAPAPLPPPVITGANPSSTVPGTTVTLSGQNFGATQGDSYLTLAQGGTSWGAPFDGAKLTITSWSDTSITFQLPSQQRVVPAQSRHGYGDGDGGRARHPTARTSRSRPDLWRASGSPRDVRLRPRRGSGGPRLQNDDGQLPAAGALLVGGIASVEVTRLRPPRLALRAAGHSAAVGSPAVLTAEEADLAVDV